MKSSLLRGVLIGLCSLGLAACTYHDEETLYPSEDTPSCDTTAVSYADFVAPLLDAHCNNCHGGEFPSANIALDTHRDVRRWAESGQLYGSMAHLDGYSRMPKSGNRLPQCDLDKVKAWIDADTPNN